MHKEASWTDDCWLAIGQEIGAVLSAIDRHAFLAVAESPNDSTKRWFFSWQGRSGLVAQMAAMRFMHLGRTSHFVGEGVCARPSGVSGVQTYIDIDVPAGTGVETIEVGGQSWVRCHPKATGSRSRLLEPTCPKIMSNLDESF